jgi:anti-sigma B factor antagonist
VVRCWLNGGITHTEAREVFDVTRTDTVFDIFDTEEEALESKVQKASEPHGRWVEQYLMQGFAGYASIVNTKIDQKTYRNRQDGTIIVLTPTGRLDINTACQFRLKLQECFFKLSPHVVVNLGQVNFIDTAGLTSLIEGLRDAVKVKGSFRICNIQPEARVVFEVTMTDTVFDIFDTEEEALESKVQEASEPHGRWVEQYLMRGFMQGFNRYGSFVNTTETSQEDL